VLVVVVVIISLALLICTLISHKIGYAKVSRNWVARESLFRAFKRIFRMKVLLTPYSMTQSPSWEADWFSASQEILRILWNQKIHYRGFDVCWTCIIVITEEWTSTRWHLLFYCFSHRLNMFRALLCPSSGARDYNVDYHISRFVLRLLQVGG